MPDNPEINESLKQRYEVLLQQEKNARPQSSNQGLFQKAQIFGLKAATAISFLNPALALIAAPNFADKASRLENPEKYYQINALERLAFEQGVLEKSNKTSPNISTAASGISDEAIDKLTPDIGFLGIKSDWTKRNEAVQKMAQLVGITDKIEYPKRTDALKSLFSSDFKASTNFVSTKLGLDKNSESKSFFPKEKSFEPTFLDQNFSPKFAGKGWINRFLNWLLGPSINETIAKLDAGEKLILTNSPEKPLENSPEKPSENSLEDNQQAKQQAKQIAKIISEQQVSKNKDNSSSQEVRPPEPAKTGASRGA
jgi:hypothetical protein